VKGITILAIDDEPAIRKLLRVGLEAVGFQILEAATGEEGINQAAQHKPDLILLDLSLPDMDGREVIRRLREWTQTPVLILTVRDSDADKVALLDAGADDYVTKPFSMTELQARIRSALRHAVGTASEACVTTAALEIDLASRLVRLRGREIHLTVTEYALLALLARNVGKVVTQRRLLNDVWGPHAVDRTHYLRVHIGQLRKKIEDDPSRPRLLMTEAGVGYRLTATASS
jgi:two-component system KDP operon response regulator KdpE